MTCSKTLKGKKAFVTGGKRRIGRGIALALAEAGCDVGINDLTHDQDGDTTLSLIRDMGREAELFAGDISSSKVVNNMFDDFLARFGRIDILVNNAGVQLEKTVVNSTDEDWNQLMGTNARGVFLVCRRFIPIMTATGGGSIINIGSISGEHADPTMALYNASKAFVAGLTRSIAVDHGAEGIRCNTICPGWIMTGMVDAAFSLAKDPAASKTDGLARHPVGRWGQPEDIAAAAVWLLLQYRSAGFPRQAADAGRVFLSSWTNSALRFRSWRTSSLSS